MALGALEGHGSTCPEEAAVSECEGAVDERCTGLSTGLVAGLGCTVVVLVLDLVSLPPEMRSITGLTLRRAASTVAAAVRRATPATLPPEMRSVTGLMLRRAAVTVAATVRRATHATCPKRDGCLQSSWRVNVHVPVLVVLIFQR